MAEEQPKPHRLTPVDRTEELHPWRHASTLTGCHLYWAPASSFPIPAQERQWLMAFLDRFADLAKNKLGLRVEVFFQMRMLYPNLMDAFTANILDMPALVGLTRREGEKIPSAPSLDDIQAVIDGKKQYRSQDYMPELTYWFVKKVEKKQRELFFGHGGMTIAYLKPDPNAVAPPLMISKKVRAHPMFKEFDIDALHEQTFAMTDNFQQKSKAYFGAGLESHPVYRGLRFVLPVLEATEFFKPSADSLKKWFEIFPILFGESPADKGVLLAFGDDFEEDLIELLRKMKEDGLKYPER